MKTVEIRIEIIVEAPFLFRSGAALPLGVDAATLTDAKGAPMIPGTHLKGHLRHALKVFAASTPGLDVRIDAWLGRESQDHSNDSPSRGRLDFDAYWVAIDERRRALASGQWLPLPALSAISTGQGSMRYRVRIDDTTGAADPGALQVIGQTHEPGSRVAFEAGVRLSITREAEAEEIVRWLDKALGFTPALGALKGIGFGRIVDHRITQRSVEIAVLDPPDDANAASRDLCFELDRPYCFGARALGGNRFESVAHVPGGAIRGALFAWCTEASAAGDETTRQDAGLILEQADHITANHAWASQGARRPAVVAQSAVAVVGEFVDASVPPFDRPFVVRQGKSALVPAFENDWKLEYADYAARHGFVDPERWVEVRTAIDEQAGSAKEQSLFAYECRLPASADQPLEFRSRIALVDLDGDQRSALWSALSRVLPHALRRLGKTEAAARKLRWTATAEPATPTDAQRIVLMLNSDALLAQPALGADANEAALMDAYQAYFQRVSQRRLTLIDLFADQRLVGGPYFKHRFWSKQPGYRARVLTLAGSVFVFSAKDLQIAQTVLQRWLAAGLPSDEGEDWRSNPYVSANGYGEVRIGTGIRVSDLSGSKLVWADEVGQPREVAS